ncbi:acyltransferase [Beijerinckia indica]|uniref:Acyltransferase 3 n=1 Tax=Beijerinckia indica subsp. indica (strain ATCC 9039 / DSM 1715 / NCIMB 8712) TaxID=395963 RepID=B2IH53_BEII9|nr:acyltransferase family protein [Beijerinckia indica]ACB94467.1 acyltransferase 3 [Beijerinckia indica subsp. indica ATCC 9039]
MSDDANIGDIHDKKRNAFLDFVKGIAIFLVVAVHTAAPFSVAYKKIPALDWQILNVYNSLSHVCVPLFVMTTGALLLPRKIERLDTFLLRRLPRSLIPLVGWVVIYSLVDSGGKATISDMTTAFFTASGKYHLWFLYMISGLYLVIPFLSAFYRAVNMSMKTQLLVIWFLCEAIQMAGILTHGAISGISFVTAQMANTYAGYLVLGAVLAEGNFVGKWWHGPAFFTSGMIAAGLTWFATDRQQSAVTTFIDYGSPFIIIMSVLAYLFLNWIWTRLRTDILLKPFVFLGKLSLGIYVLHLLILDFIWLHIANPLMYGGPGISFLPIITVTILVCVPIVLIGRRILLLNWLFGA